MEKIPCTIGILAFNSIDTLPRALESVKDFAEVIVADGGSTDGTPAFAVRTGARVIEQSRVQLPIEDFALERNRLMQVATQPWFFYLDADEVMSEELRDDIAHVSALADGPKAYRVRYLKTSSDLSKKYRTYREYYQIRLTRTDIGARFERPVHERIVVPKDREVGQIEGPWYVPLDAGDLSLRTFAGKAWKRTKTTMDNWRPNGLLDVVRKIAVDPLLQIAKSLFKMIATPLKYGTHAIPLRYELLRVLYACMLSVRAVERVLQRR